MAEVAETVVDIVAENEVQTVDDAHAYIPTSAILDGTFFTVTHFERDSCKIKAQCNNCTAKTVISGSTNVLSNFTTHLKVFFAICHRFNDSTDDCRMKFWVLLGRSKAYVF